MGYANADLLRQWERAQRAGDEIARVRLEKLIDASQAECSHPLDDRAQRVCDKTSPSGKYKQGQRLTYCRCCAKILEDTNR